jgi:hypothetical protein
MTLQERIHPYTALEPHSVDDYVVAAFAIDEEHRSGDITTVEMGNRLAMLSAMYRDLRSERSAARRLSR